MQYYGGFVIPNVEVFTIFYGDVPNKNRINKFYQDIVNSPYLDWLNEYSTPTQKIGRGKFIGTYTYPALKQNLDSDTELVPLIITLIKNKRIPNITENTYYAIHVGPGITVMKSGGKSCEAYCAFHGTFSLSNDKLPYGYYGVMPDFSVNPCRSNCGYASTPFDIATYVSSHELVEAITDPGVGAGNYGWYHSSGGEISDVCNEVGTDVIYANNYYHVSKQWSNKMNGCIYNYTITATTTKIPPRTTLKTTTTTKTTLKTTTTTPKTTTSIKATTIKQKR